MHGNPHDRKQDFFPDQLDGYGMLVELKTLLGVVIKRMDKMEEDIFAAIASLKTDTRDKLDDHETRLRNLESAKSAATGGLMASKILIPAAWAVLAAVVILAFKAIAMVIGLN